MAKNEKMKEAKEMKEPTLQEKLGKGKKMSEPQAEENLNAEDDLNTADELPAIEDEQPIRKAVEERGGSRRRRSPIRCNCQTCSCFGCLSIILLVVIVVLAVYFRPPFLLNPLKKYVNQGYQPTAYETSSVVDINNQIATSITLTGEATITEEQLQTLIAQETSTENIYVDIEPSSIRVVTDVDETSAVPLYLLIEISHTSDDKLLITKLGFQRFGAPKFIRDILTDSAFGLLDASTADGGDEGTQFINSFINQDNEDDIAGVRFEKDQVVIFEK